MENKIVSSYRIEEPVMNTYIDFSVVQESEEFFRLVIRTGARHNNGSEASFNFYGIGAYALAEMAEGLQKMAQEMEQIEDDLYQDDEDDDEDEDDE